MGCVDVSYQKRRGEVDGMDDMHINPQKASASADVTSAGLLWESEGLKA